MNWRRGASSNYPGGRMKHARHWFGTLVLFACLQPALAQEEIKPLVVIDLRPSEEKEGNGLLPLDGKCNKDVYRVADVATDPLKVDLLKKDLTMAFADAGGGRTLTVLDWSIYYNKQVQKGGGGFLNSVGIQGYNVPAKEKTRKPGSLCSKKESAGGWYKGDELTSVFYPLISEFTGTYAGKPVNVRVVYSPTSKLEGKFQGDAADTAALLDTVHKTSEAVIAVIGR
jgi:hypothetical protein